MYLTTFIVFGNGKFPHTRKERVTMKCPHCKKKSHLAFVCTCALEFCVKCRTPEVHGCTAKEEKKVELVKVVADKLPERI
jgi:predicted nucleic acid binding AN1-type Zn finger protein